MKEKFLKAFRGAREHWLFWPFLLLIIQIVIYNFLFSKNGYLAYLEKIKEKKDIQRQINELLKKKAELSNKLAHVKNEKEAINTLVRKLYLYDEKYTIIKFVDDKKHKGEVKEKKMNLRVIQRLYILISTTILFLLTGLFWRRDKNLIQDET